MGSRGTLRGCGSGNGDAQVRAAVVDDESEGVVNPARVPERAQAADEEAHHLHLRQGVVHEGRPGGGGSDGGGGADVVEGFVRRPGTTHLERTEKGNMGWSSA